MRIDFPPGDICVCFLAFVSWWLAEFDATLQRGGGLGKRPIGACPA
jgi:hypothetical protein